MKILARCLEVRTCDSESSTVNCEAHAADDNCRLHFRSKNRPIRIQNRRSVLVLTRPVIGRRIRTPSGRAPLRHPKQGDQPDPIRCDWASLRASGIDHAIPNHRQRIALPIKKPLDRDPKSAISVGFQSENDLPWVPLSLSFRAKECASEALFESHIKSLNGLELSNRSPQASSPHLPIL
jgi:hypothetical protein